MLFPSNEVPFGAANEDAMRGAAYVFTRTDGIWSESQRLTASDGQPLDQFGIMLALDGDTLTASAVWSLSQPGSVYVFTNSGGIWSESQKLTASDGVALDLFGTSVSISDHMLVVGANSAKIGDNFAQGAAYVFVETNGVWVETQKLIADDGAAYDNYGFAVAIQGSTILVGSPIASLNGHRQKGAVYVYTMTSNGVWSFAQKLTSADHPGNFNFGSAVALDNGTAMVAACVPSHYYRQEKGGVYVFTEAGGSFSPKQELTPSDGAGADGFGLAISLSQGRALIGAFGARVNGRVGQGKAYLFDGTNGTWTQSKTLTSRDGQADDEFGVRVALDGSTSLVGTLYHEAAYFYAPPENAP
jgi:FG-GAP repeat